MKNIHILVLFLVLGLSLSCSSTSIQENADIQLFSIIKIRDENLNDIKLEVELYNTTFIDIKLHLFETGISGFPNMNVLEIIDIHSGEHLQFQGCMIDYTHDDANVITLKSNKKISFQLTLLDFYLFEENKSYSVKYTSSLSSLIKDRLRFYTTVSNRVEFTTINRKMTHDKKSNIDANKQCSSYPKSGNEIKNKLNISSIEKKESNHWEDAQNHISKGSPISPSVSTSRAKIDRHGNQK